MPPVSVVIVTWNGRALLERFLPSVLATDYPALEVVVADNASSDGTAEWLASAQPRVRVVRHAENRFFAGGNNGAVAHTRGEVLVFLNNDVEVPPDWLTPLVRAATAPGVAAAQPKLLQTGHRTRFEYAGASGGFLDRDGIPFTRGRLFSSLEPDVGQYDDARDVFWATGAALAVRREAFVQAGGFDASFEMHMEEIDLCWRLWRAGWRVRVAPQSRVYHLGGASLPQGSARKTFYNYRNGLSMLAKNLPDAELGPVLRRRRVLDAVAAGHLLASGHRDAAVAVRDAWRAFERLLPALPRPEVGEPVVRPPYRRSIVADHFLRRVRRFSDLPASGFAPGWADREL